MYVCMYGIHVTGAARVLYNYYEVLVVQYLAVYMYIIVYVGIYSATKYDVVLFSYFTIAVQ